jgi:hypothetical protein
VTVIFLHLFVLHLAIVHTIIIFYAQILTGFIKMIIIIVVVVVSSSSSSSSYGCKGRGGASEVEVIGVSF